MKVLILDAYNVIYAVPELARQLDQSLEAARKALLSLCVRIAVRGDIARIDVVFDGAGDYEETAWEGKKVRAVYSSREDKADDCILKMLEDSGRGDFTIVSKDNYVFNNSKAHCASVISPEAFMKTYVKSETSNKKTAPSVSQETARKITEEYKKHLGL